MLKVRTRLTSALVTVWAVLFVLALPASASAQLADVTDAPLAIRNATDTHVSIEVIAVLRRNGTVTPVNGTYQCKSGDYFWLEANKVKLTGVAFAFFMRTPNGHESRWVMTSHGADKHGCFHMDITKSTLQAHLQTRPPQGGYDRGVPAAQPWQREFLQEQIKRVQEVIRQYEQLLVGQKQRMELAEGAVEVFGWHLENSPNETDRSAAGPFKVGGGGAVWLGKQQLASIEARLRTNQALLQRYQAEFGRLAPGMSPV